MCVHDSLMLMWVGGWVGDGLFVELSCCGLLLLWVVVVVRCLARHCCCCSILARQRYISHTLSRDSPAVATQGSTVTLRYTLTFCQGPTVVLKKLQVAHPRTRTFQVCVPVSKAAVSLW